MVGELLKPQFGAGNRLDAVPKPVLLAAESRRSASRAGVGRARKFRVRRVTPLSCFCPIMASLADLMVFVAKVPLSMTKRFARHSMSSFLDKTG